MIKTTCPHCGHKITIPESVTQYTCICGIEYNIVIQDGTNPTITKQVRTAEREESSDREEFT